MFQYVFNHHALGGILHQELRDEVLALSAHITPNLVVEVYLLQDCLLADLFVVLGVERQMSTQQHVNYDAE